MSILDNETFLIEKTDVPNIGFPDKHKYTILPHENIITDEDGEDKNVGVVRKAYIYYNNAYFRPFWMKLNIKFEKEGYNLKDQRINISIKELLDDKSIVVDWQKIYPKNHENGKYLINAYIIYASADEIKKEGYVYLRTRRVQLPIIQMVDYENEAQDICYNIITLFKEHPELVPVLFEKSVRLKWNQNVINIASTYDELKKMI